MSGIVQEFVGTWEVYGCGYLVNPSWQKQDFQGVRCCLDETGDVSWSVPEEFSDIPLFTCETYEIYRTSSGYIIRFGAYNGHVFVFRTDQSESKIKDNITLTCEDFWVLYCKRVKEDKKIESIRTTFSLLTALEDGHFSDITLTSSNKKEFHVHSSVLNLLGEGIDWKSNPFSNVSEEVLGTILHYLYAECLPENLTESTAKLVIEKSTPHSCLNKLVNLCKTFLKNTALKQQIIGLVNDMHTCMNQIIDNFTNKEPSLDNIASNPAKLCFALKQSICDGAIAGVKLLLLCDLLTKRKNELTRKERHEVIRYAKSRLPVFLSQLTKFLQLLKTILSSMSPAQKMELTRYLVPEIEAFVDVFFLITMKVERVMDHLIQNIAPESGNSKSSMSNALGKTISSMLHIKELTKMKGIHDHIVSSLAFLSQKQGDFKELSSSQKMRSISRNLDQLVEELPIFLIRLGGATNGMDEKLEWKEFKFCFKIGASKISCVLDKLVAHRDELEDIMIQICNLVQRDEFTQSLQMLGLLKSNTVLSTEAQKNSGDSFSMPLYCHNYNLNLVESLCVPPSPTKSNLSKKCLQIFLSETEADMELEISSTVDNSSSEELSPTEEKCVIQAHRVILAARCDWFKRALLSGMREAIDRKIAIHDTNPALFRIILEFLYSGRLKETAFSTEQLIELLLLSDQFEIDTLKQTAEIQLQENIDMDSALYFLSMADQYNANILKKSCLQFIAKHQKLTFTELFYELPISLQTEIFDHVWTNCPPRKSSTTEKLLSSDSNSPAESVHDFFKPESSSELLSSRNSSLEDMRILHNPSRLESSIREMRDIVGDHAPRELLVRVILAADYDLCRAVNFFYERYSGNDE